MKIEMLAEPLVLEAVPKLDWEPDRDQTVTRGKK
jgi:hypothetical protein